MPFDDLRLIGSKIGARAKQRRKSVEVASLETSNRFAENRFVLAGERVHGCLRNP
jgi:hypothetical protein